MAMTDVREGKLTAYAAAKRYNVPRRTLDDRIKGRVEHGTNPGPSTVLTSEEEASLVAYLLYMAQHGFPLTPTMTKAFAWAIAIRSGKGHRFSDVGPSMHWWTNFRRRHPQLTLRKMDNLERSRAECLTPEIVNDYFDLLDKILTNNNLKHRPRQIYNCDETFLPLDQTKEKAVTSKQAKSVYSQSLGTTEHITLLCTGSASGAALPPMIVYPQGFPGGQYRFGGPDDSVYAKSESGWIDSELFYQWMKKIFLKFAVPERPLLLIVDGHKSHITLDLIDLAKKNKIILFCLPPHTTHALQPLDVCVFRSLKTHFSRSLRAACFARKDFVVSKRDFARVVKEPFEKALSMSNIKSGFSTCGIFPFNRNAIDKTKMFPAGSSSSSNNNNGSSSSSSSNNNNGSSSSTDLDQSEAEVNQPLMSSPQLFSTDESVLAGSSPPSSTDVSDVTSVDSTAQVPSTPSTFSPPIFSSPSSGGSYCSRQIVNPLVSAGLVSANLADILSTPAMDSADKPKRRVVKARVLTEDEYVNILKEKDRKEKEAAELKEQRKIERARKKREQEERKKELAKKREEKKKEQEAKKKQQQQKKRKRRKSAVRSEDESHHSNSEEDMDCENNPGPRGDGPSEPPLAKKSRTRSLRMPSRYRKNSDVESSDDGNESDTICSKCNSREPELSDGSDHIFWIDCDSCGKWYHTLCVYGENGKTQRFLCKDCLP